VAPLRRELHAHCYRMLGSTHDADDALQEALLRAWRGLGRFEGRSSTRSWLYRIATNTAYDHLRRRRRANLAPLLAAENLAYAQALESRVDCAELVCSALAQLPPHYRAPLLLQVCAGHSLGEIAAALGCTPDAVKMRLLRARARFRQVYQG